MSSGKSQMRCPQCDLDMAFDKEVFSKRFHCPRCGARLLVSEAYSRMLVVISIAHDGKRWVPGGHLTVNGGISDFSAAARCEGREQLRSSHNTSDECQPCWLVIGGLPC